MPARSIRALVIANGLLMEDVERCKSSVSTGSIRGKPARFDFPDAGSQTP